MLFPKQLCSPWSICGCFFCMAFSLRCTMASPVRATSVRYIVHSYMLFSPRVQIRSHLISSQTGVSYTMDIVWLKGPCMVGDVWHSADRGQILCPSWPLLSIWVFLPLKQSSFRWAQRCYLFPQTSVAVPDPFTSQISGFSQVLSQAVGPNSWSPTVVHMLPEPFSLENLET